MSETTDRTSPTITSQAFEEACDHAILGSLWDNGFNTDYQETVSLTIREMRYIANVIRTAQGLELGIVRDEGETDTSDSDES